MDSKISLKWDRRLETASSSDVYKRQRLNSTMKKLIDFDRKQLQKQLQSYIFQQPSRLYENYAQKLDQLTQTLENDVDNLVKDRLNRVQQLQGRLQINSPQHTIEWAQETVTQLQNRLLSSAKNLSLIHI